VIPEALDAEYSSGRDLMSRDQLDELLITHKLRLEDQTADGTELLR
jgi:hypothetical protein